MQHYDVVIVGGAMMGSSVAWHLLRAGVPGQRILIVERDPSYEDASTSHSNSCIRQQFTTEVNIRISLYGAEVVRNFRALADDPEAPQPRLQEFGYLYLAGSEAAAANLARAQALQAGLGAGTVLMTPEEVQAAYPFYDLSGIHLCSLGTRDEGYFDGAAIFDHWRRSARRQGVEFRQGEVGEVTLAGDRVASVGLTDGSRVGCDWLVNAAGPRAARVAAMAGLQLPVEPRKRYTYVFDAERPLPRDLPLTVDPSGVHVRTDGTGYMAGCKPVEDGPVDPDDFDIDHTLWEEMVWPAIAARIPSFEAIRLRRVWAGHYAYNTLDQNAVVGPHDRVENFLFVNGFSGHGLQQAPAMGRGIAEWITQGRWATLDLSDLSYARIAAGKPLCELAVI
ncbi:NAD(P)/FAD-dependent oxidoreductase [Frigidibacter sp. ROC022]|uniref:NAD(P)/FAD-dependent oxidoreductase n=1 Tax=Frigidibacter sp. ROC022 TaxID=2971796 RepID=UPI00215A2C65|nr:FAD-binding oxidoreductase [Frigidibacter sp. ROC022]MCR8725145.1 FAD-binding oxidoreductase [Frigidibacter sp. ROC022]